MVEEISSPAPTYQQPTKGRSQPLPREVEAYLEESSSEEEVLKTIQWLFNHVETDIKLVHNKALAPIRATKRPRHLIMRAIYDYQEQKDSLQGRHNWAASKSATAKQGAQAIQELVNAMQPIAEVPLNKSLPQNIQRAATSLVSHLRAVKVTYNKPQFMTYRSLSVPI